ncbi:hypothetical protein Peur_058670 [Populus x canadensis]
MARNLVFMLALTSLYIGLAGADWNILNKKVTNRAASGLKSYCESWRINVEQNNIKGFEVVPQECMLGFFYVDDTFLSTIPYFKKHGFGREKLNATLLEAWMKQGKALALDHTLKLFNEIKDKRVKIFLISSRSETLRSATVDNLINVGYHGWCSFILRSLEDDLMKVQQYKSEARQRLIKEGYRI